MIIDDFRGEYRWLSNFHLAPVFYADRMYPSSEHAYQAAKSESDEVRAMFARMTMPCRDAKRMGRSILCRPGWEELRYDVMTTILADKFTRHANLRDALKSTQDATLIEGNTWHDNYWGTCRCAKCGDRGENRLGEILMKIRAAL